MIASSATYRAAEGFVAYGLVLALVWVRLGSVDVALTDGSQQIMLFTSAGKAVRFDERDVRPMGRTACGVRVWYRISVMRSWGLARSSHS